ncbi:MULTISPECIES: hypothetical protein [Klebsiella/Raoultella group]|nr:MULTISPECIES: hypothetical protein [Klebsiella/Raoultella group]MEB7619812.1 hypothetical protein [Klebsiella aerogenes]
MKPEHLHRLTGRDVLRWRRKPQIDFNTGLAIFVGLSLTVTLFLLIARVA